MSTIKELLEKVELHIEHGDLQAAREALEEVKTKDLVGSQTAIYVRAYRRIGMAEVGLRLLNPQLKNKSYKASSSEWAEYAMCLNAVGAGVEAREILEQKCSEDPYYNLYQGFSLIYEWDYAGAVSFLEKAILSADLPEYQIQVARINLLSCYIAEEMTDQAQNLFEQVEQGLSSDYKRLRTNLRELQLQLFIIQKKYQAAMTQLEATSASSPMGGPEVFYFRKWKTILEVEMGIQSKQALELLRDEAMTAGMWEVARDCDARVAYLTEDPLLLKRIYYATPWVSFRKRVLRRFGKVIDFSQPFAFWLLPAGKTPPAQIDGPHAQVDVERGVLGTLSLKKGSLAHRLLRALASDLYRPHPVGRLFYMLFEGEKFDLNSSSQRVYRSVNELRELFSENNIPLEIEQGLQGYRLVAKDLVCLQIPSEKKAGKLDLRLLPLREKGFEQFTAAQAAETLGVSLRTAQRILTDAISAGEVLRVGEGPKANYVWVKKDV